MKKNYFFILITATTIGGLAFTKMSKKAEIGKCMYKNLHLKYSNGAINSGVTGAPDGGNSAAACTVCHSGSVQTGPGNTLVLLDANQNPVTEYTPGATYTVKVTITSPNAKNGFQTTARRLSDNTTAGSFAVGGGNVRVDTWNSKQYATHTMASNTSQTGWTFTWTAPASNVGNVVFYLATNKTNNNNQSSGDVIRTSQHTFSAAASASIEEIAPKITLAVGFVKENNSLVLDFSSVQAGEGSINLVDMSGKSVFYTKTNDVKIGSNKDIVILPKELKEGIYIVNFFVNNNSVTKKIMITK